VSEKTFRCGWRVDYPAGINARLDHWGATHFPQVVIRRGPWRATMYPEMYDAMSDEQFADYMGRAYRESAFDQLQQDLDALARHVAGFEAGFGASAPSVPYSDVKAALWRWQQVTRDTEPEYEKFMHKARSAGLSLRQAETVFRSGNFLAGIGDLTARPEDRLEHFAKHGYLTVLLGEVLTLEELTKQSFGYGTVLNDQMDRRYGKHFAEMDRDRQRVLVESAIEVTAQLGGAEDGWPLERAMVVVMPDLGDV
jgi:hypothetical protein